MKVTRVELNSEGIKELLKSPEMLEMCEEQAQRAVNQLPNIGYSAMVYVGETRVNASVHADSIHAKRDNAKHNSILKAVFSK